jgi:hypothetical protein
LRAKVAARAAEAKPLAVIAAPSISDSLLAELGDFVVRFGEGAAWGAMDDSGLVALHGHGLEDVQRPRRRLLRKNAGPIASHSDFLSDLGQWMLKVVVSHLLPPELRVASPVNQQRADAPIANATMLSKAAGVSVPSAARFVAALRKETFLAEEERFLRIIRIEQLLDQWRAVYKRQPSEVRARWLLSRKSSDAQLQRAVAKWSSPENRACLGLFAAGERLGFPFVRGVAPHLYLERVSIEALRELGLRLAEPGEPADVIIREPRYAESVFRGARVHDGVPVADVLQCWLDVASSPARGEEMAAHLYESVIYPNLVEDRNGRG